jgi:hypothetical protein
MITEINFWFVEYDYVSATSMCATCLWNAFHNSLMVTVRHVPHLPLPIIGSFLHDKIMITLK